MKLFSLLLGSAFGGEEVPGQNGWTVGCRIETPNRPAFAFVDEGDLYFTSFQAVGSDHVYRIKNFTGDIAACKNKDFEIEMLYERTFPWPNSVQRVPDSIFNVSSILLEIKLTTYKGWKQVVLNQRRVLSSQRK